MKREDVEYKYCCGCGLCSSFVEGKKDTRGFYRPKKELFQTKFDTSVCYCNYLINSTKQEMWGHVKNAYFCYSNNEYVRKRASSGGALTEISHYLIKNHIVDEIIQIKLDENDLLNTVVIHNTEEDTVYECCGSRYTSSASLQGLLDCIDLSRRYAVVGKPCDIRVLREYMKKNDFLSSSIVLLLSFFCGGTPSYQANEKLMNKMGLERHQLKMFNYRGNGWPGKTVGIQKNGKTSEIEYEESWGAILGRDLQEICRFCWEGVGEAADISCGDGWYLENGEPSFEEKEGRNVVLARTNYGDDILRDMSKKNLITLEKMESLDILESIQPGQFMRKCAMFSRIFAMKIMGKAVPKYNMKQLFLYAKKIPFTLNIRMFGGTVKRVIKGNIK